MSRVLDLRTGVLGNPTELQQVASSLHKKVFQRCDGQRFRCLVTEYKHPSTDFDFLVSIISDTTQGGVQDALASTMSIRGDVLSPVIPCALLALNLLDLSSSHLTTACVELYRAQLLRLYVSNGKVFQSAASLGFESSQTLEIYIANMVYPMVTLTPFQAMVVNLGSRILTAIASLFAFRCIRKDNTDLHPTDITLDEYNETIAEDARPLESTPEENNINMLFNGLISKQTVTPWEVDHMELIRKRTSIPVPRAHHSVLSLKGQPCMIIMQFIPGQRLLERWPSLSWWKKFRVACTLRVYVSQLRRFSRVFPGSATRPGIVSGALFDDRQWGIFNSLDTFRYWFEILTLDGYNFSKTDDHSPQSAPVPDSVWSDLVFCHNGLHPSNIILGDDGQLWLIDWANSGFYPPAFEGVSMSTLCSDKDDPSWIAYRKWIVGPDVPSLCEASRMAFSMLARRRWRDGAQELPLL